MSANAASIDRAFRIRSIVKTGLLRLPFSVYGADQRQFRSLLRQSRQFASYNFREYAKRRTKDRFRQNQGITDQKKMENLMREATVGLQVLKVSEPL